MNSNPNVNFFRGLGKNAAGQWAFRDEGLVGPHVLARPATKPTVMRTAGVAAATRLIGADGTNIFNEPQKTYIGYEHRPQRLIYTGQAVVFGVNGRF